MKIMDHDEAVRLQAAEKYLLGQLPKEQHAAYEEHYFDCSVCTEEIKATAAFMEGARQVAREQSLQTIDAKRLTPATPSNGGWFAWLKPAFAIPVMAALLLFIGYQNGVTIPNLKQGSSRTAIGEVTKSFPIMHLDSRGTEALPVKFSVGPQQGFDIDVDITGDSPAGFTCQIQDEAGDVLIPFHVSEEDAKKTVRYHILGGSLRPGKYKLVVFAGQAPTTRTDNAGVTGQKSFIVEFVQ
jgi:hypothetical protein